MNLFHSSLSKHRLPLQSYICTPMYFWHKLGFQIFSPSPTYIPDISLSIQPSLWIPTTLRCLPHLPVSARPSAKIADPPKFSEHSRLGGTPEPRHRPATLRRTREKDRDGYNFYLLRKGDSTNISCKLGSYIGQINH